MILRCRKIIYFLLFAFLFPPGATSQHWGIPELFMQIDTEPQIIHCKNELEVNNQGGHLQGVQLLLKNNTEYAILSGSSDTYAYYSLAILGNYNRVQSVNILMHKPFKHAGGIQILQNILVVGIEDNDAKDKSRVCIYDFGNPDVPPLKQLAMIERTGEPFRCSAGCTGIARMGKQYLVVVGDWDTKHLDFYLSEENKLRHEINAFEEVYTIDTEKIDRSSWTDIAWHAYQNINLLKDADGKLYLFGFGQNVHGENIADLFLLEHKDLREFYLKKLKSKTFNCRKGADFRSAAGISRQLDGKLKIITCGSHMRDSLVLNIFE